MRTATLPILTAVFLALPAGCVRFHDHPLSAEKSVAALESRSLDDPGLRWFIQTGRRDSLPVWPLPSWGLPELTAAALYFNPELDLARAQWAGAEGAAKEAAARANPALTVTPGRNTTTRTPSPWIPTAVLDLTVETAGKRVHRAAQAAHLAEAARLNLSSVAWRVRSAVREALLELYVSQEQAALAGQAQSLQAERLRLTELRYEAGEIPAFELAQVRIEAGRTGLASQDAASRSAGARVQLAAAVGITTSALDKIYLSFDSLMQPLPQALSLPALRRQALTGRPDILAALSEYAASQENLRLEISRQYPDLTLSPGYEYDQGDNKWSLGLGLALPVLNRNRGAIARAGAARAESAARFNLLQAGVLAGIDRAIAGYRAAGRKQAGLDSLLAELTQQEKTAQAVYAAGEISRGELLGLELELNAASRDRLEALAQAQREFGALEDALQSPFEFSTDLRESPQRGPGNGAENENR